MGRAKQKMMDDEVDDALIDFLKELSQRDELKGALNGIAKQVISKGVKSMSEKQKEVIDNFTTQYKRNHTCERCSNGNISVLSDYIHVADYGLCPMCQYDKEQYMKY
jgi:hypothetical protein